MGFAHAFRRRTSTRPKGEKLAQTLAQAGFIKSGAAQTFQVIRVFCAVGGRDSLSSGAPISGTEFGRIMMFTLAGVTFGLFMPSYYISRRARKRQGAIAKQLSDVLDLLVVCVEAGSDSMKRSKSSAPRPNVRSRKSEPS